MIIVREILVLLYNSYGNLMITKKSGQFYFSSEENYFLQRKLKSGPKLPSFTSQGQWSSLFY